ncbi:universal stress protein [Rhodocaloribacter sp.]
MMKKNVLLALEGAVEEAPVIRQAVEMARRLDAGLTVLHVNSPRAGRISLRMEPEPLVTESDIRNLFRILGFEKEADAIDVRVETSPTVSREIVEASRDATLLIVGRSQRNRIAAALTESIDKHLPDRVACPLMYVPKARVELRTFAEEERSDVRLSVN